ncbi:MAG TPA: hypothetical protein VNJ04_16645 [Gemmatimonadaceae bacterium]|nr:hypothetical protein [Gemmatimonadaceae bacterium]
MQVFSARRVVILATAEPDFGSDVLSTLFDVVRREFMEVAEPDDDEPEEPSDDEQPGDVEDAG